MKGWKTIAGFVLYAAAGGLAYLQLYDIADALQQFAEALIGIGVVHKAVKGQLTKN